MSFREFMSKEEKKEGKEEKESVSESPTKPTKPEPRPKQEQEQEQNHPGMDVEVLKLVEYRYFRERLEGTRGQLGKEDTVKRLVALCQAHLETIQSSSQSR